MNDQEYDKVMKAHLFQYNNAISSLLGAVGKEIFELSCKEKKKKIIECLEKIEETFNLKVISKCLIINDNINLKANSVKWLNKSNVKRIKFNENMVFKRRGRRSIDVMKLDYTPNLKDTHSKYDSNTLEGFRDFFVNISNIAKNRKRKVRSWKSLYKDLKHIHKQLNEFRSKNNYRDKVLHHISGKEIRHSPPIKISSRLKEYYGESEPPLLMQAHDLLDSIQKHNKDTFYKVLSPSFLSVYEKETDTNTRNVLSPNLFPLYTPEVNDSSNVKNSNDVILPIPYLLQRFGIDKKNRDNILELIMEVSGVSESIDQMVNKFNGESELRDDFDGISHVIKDSFNQLENTFTMKQKRDLSKKSYTFMTRKQIEFLFDKNGVYKTEKFPFDLDDYEIWTEVDKREALINKIYEIANIKYGKRSKRQTLLSPFAFAPTIKQIVVLAPIILSPSLFSPSILAPLLLSPPIGSPHIGDPLIFSPYVLGPNILSPAIFAVYVFSPYVLSPNIINPYVLSPIILSPHVLCPDILSPTILSGAILNPFVMSPAIFTESALAADVLSPSILSNGKK
uniref:Uncharacterized protein n=1 Tax=Parastrongyloides trichosuri TaxID=131310 RepID=A0A0N4ZW31_PARTI